MILAFFSVNPPFSAVIDPSFPARNRILTVILLSGTAKVKSQRKSLNNIRNRQFTIGR